MNWEVTIMPTDFFQLSNFIFFVAGMFVARAWHCAKNRYLNWSYGADMPQPKWGVRGTALIGAVILLTGSVFVGVQTQNNATTIRNLTTQTQECYRQFSVALRARSAIGLENDQLSRVQRDAIANWLGALLNPPSEIRDLPQTAPARREWGLKVTQQYFAIIDDARKQEIANDQERAQHPLPEPNCGQ
jgi:hypothetical protein